MQQPSVVPPRIAGGPSNTNSARSAAAGKTKNNRKIDANSKNAQAIGEPLLDTARPRPAPLCKYQRPRQLVEPRGPSCPRASPEFLVCRDAAQSSRPARPETPPKSWDE